jgi:hypothetical protein
MEFSEYENIEIFNNTQRFAINKCKNQILSKLMKSLGQPIDYYYYRFLIYTSQRKWKNKYIFDNNITVSFQC